PQPVKETKAPPKKEKAPAKPTPVEKESVNLTKVKSKEKQALDKIKKMSALDKIKNEVTEEDKKSKAAAKKAALNRPITAGTPLTGLDKIEAVQYLQLLDARIKENWTLPQWLMSKNLKAQVLVKFNTVGQIIATKLLLSSGNSTYDGYCLQAVNNSAPFPKAPDKFSEKFSVDGLIVGFPD
ncbi:MAG: TonB C-terminal domain-containing protein, partial [Pseudobdellovibrio sp.]